jgi:hypothetical protein
VSVLFAASTGFCFDHFLVEKVGQLERRHRQQLDRLLQRWRQDELLNEFCVKPLLDAH